MVSYSALESSTNNAYDKIMLQQLILQLCNIYNGDFEASCLLVTLSVTGYIQVFKLVLDQLECLEKLPAGQASTQNSITKFDKYSHQRLYKENDQPQ